MVIKVKDDSEKFHCKLKLKDCKREGKFAYRIKMSGKDEVGRSELEGILLFTGNQMRIKLSKVYANRDKAG